jgi:hypothetical protein
MTATADSAPTKTRSSTMAAGVEASAVHRTAPVTPSNASSLLIPDAGGTAKTVQPSTAISALGHAGQLRTSDP